MKKTITLALLLSLALMLCACGKTQSAQDRTPAAEAQITANIEAAPGRQDGERFETVIQLEGMEETVRYEHVRSEALGFEMDYDYESLTRRSEPGRERFLSVYDDPEDPLYYLELSSSDQEAETAAAAVAESLSAGYEITRETRELDKAGSCIVIEVTGSKGGGLPDELQTVYVVPAPDGCRIAAAHYTFEGAEGFGRRFAYLMQTLTVFRRAA